MLCVRVCRHPSKTCARVCVCSVCVCAYASYKNVCVHADAPLLPALRGGERAHGGGAAAALRLGPQAVPAHRPRGAAVPPFCALFCPIFACFCIFAVRACVAVCVVQSCSPVAYHMVHRQVQLSGLVWAPFGQLLLVWQMRRTGQLAQRLYCPRRDDQRCVCAVLGHRAVMACG